MEKSCPTLPELGKLIDSFRSQLENITWKNTSSLATVGHGETLFYLYYIYNLYLIQQSLLKKIEDVSILLTAECRRV